MSRTPGRWSVAAVLGLALAGVQGCISPADRLSADPVLTTARYACLNEVARRCGARVSADELTGVFTVQLGERRVAAAPGIAAATLGARVLTLSDEAAARHGRIYVPRWLAAEAEAYLRGRVVERLTERPIVVAPPPPPPPVKPRAVGKVCIDPGHGGKDPGAVSRRRLQEKDVVLPTALLLAAELRSRGFETVLTRESDVFVELEDRPVVATRKGADLFVSVHANAIRDASYHGIEVFYWYGSWSAASAATRREGVELAQAIKRACERGGLSVRNMRGADFKVLRYSRVPATLVEIGFLTNRAEEQALRTRAYRQRVAAAIADGIAAYRAGAK
ncbi:MAG TPA: N-acetylmuramoyl-L-alanine amidase [Planctomycetota bacterium]|nr:N-acetylmuramoyl-L-alanine amidase [Planctomycetota bacterium]